METEWIFNQLVSGMVPLFNRSGTTIEEIDELKRHIARFLELMHVQKLDVCVFVISWHLVIYNAGEIIYLFVELFIHILGSVHCYVPERGDIEPFEGSN